MPRPAGLYAATLTPLQADGSLAIDVVPGMVDFLISQGVDGLYVCGSTGEGVSLTGSERQQLAAAFIQAASGRIPVLVQVGHNSLAEAVELARHAASVGATAISATCPSYFKVNSLEVLVDCMSKLAAGAPQLPFYYYHIPSLTGNKLSMPKFLEMAAEQIPNLAGIKYTTPEVHEYQQCLMAQERRFDVFWGVDEMLLSAWIVGARAGIGSTYNVAAPLYKSLLAACEQGDFSTAAELQYLAVQMIDVLLSYPFHAALKQIMTWRGLALGPCRLPHRELSPAQAQELRERLDALGFFDWS